MLAKEQLKALATTKMADLAAKLMFIQAFNMMALMNAKALVMDIALRGSGASKGSTAAMLGLTGTCGALAEFLLCPILGRLSDTHGRKRFIVGNLMVTLMMQLLIFFRSKSKNVLFAAGVVSTASMTAFITILRAAMSDTLRGTDLGVAHARVGVAAGLGAIFGPLAAAAVSPRYGNRSVYLLAATLTGLATAMVSSQMEETLEPAQRKPHMRAGELNPFSFVRLLTNGRELATLSLALGFQCLAEPRFVLPFATLVWRERFKYKGATIERLTSIFGLFYMIGAYAAKRRMKVVGASRHVSESNLANILAYAVWARFNSLFGSVVSFLLFIPGIRKRDGLEVMITDAGTNLDWGKGEISGMMNNFKSVSAISAPALFAWVYRRSTTGGYDFPGSPMLAGAMATAVAEVLYRSL